MPRPDLSPAVPLTTTALCRVAGVSRGMLRLYEAEGLIGTPARSASGYRLFASDAPQRLLAIRLLKELGFTLKEIALLLAESDQHGLSPKRLRALAKEQVLAMDARIARLQLVRSYMARVAAGDTALVDDPDCQFLIDFLAAGAPLPRQAQAGASKHLATTE